MDTVPRSSMSAGTDIYSIPQDLLDFRETIGQIARERIAPRAAEIDEKSEYPQDVRELLAEHDILALPFEEEYGGTGTGTLMLQMAVEEIAKACASSALILMVQELGSLPIRLFGSDELKQRVLPRCASGEWTPAFALSEPEAGSDPAAMRTNAVLDGDEWVINGTKIWTSNAHHSRWMLCLLRTDPGQKGSRGLSQIIIPMDSAGVTVRPIRSVVGEHHFNQVFLDNVRVPYENVVGKPGDAWRDTRRLLANERFNFARLGQSKWHLTRLKGLAASEFDGQMPIIENPVFRARIAEAEIAIDALEMTTLRLLDRESQNQEAGSAPNIVKLQGAEVEQQLLELIADIIGPYGTPFDGFARVAGGQISEAARRSGMLVADYIEDRKFSIAGGSSEIQKNMMSRHQLEL